MAAPGTRNAALDQKEHDLQQARERLAARERAAREEAARKLAGAGRDNTVSNVEPMLGSASVRSACAFSLRRSESAPRALLHHTLRRMPQILEKHPNLVAALFLLDIWPAVRPRMESKRCQLLAGVYLKLTVIVVDAVVGVQNLNG